MTIIRPNKKLQWKLKLGALALGTLFMALVWAGIAGYGRIVTLRHEMAVLQENIRDAEIQNAEFKNIVYTMLAPGELETVAKERGLVKEKNPQYLKHGGTPEISRL